MLRAYEASLSYEVCFPRLEANASWRERIKRATSRRLQCYPFSRHFVPETTHNRDTSVTRDNATYN